MRVFLKKLGLSLSMNDPQWGRGSQNNNQGNKKPDTPPDLDQMWRDFSQRLNRLLGGKGNGGDGNGFPPGASAGRGVGLIAGIVVVIWLSSGFFIVQEGQTGVITRFGKLHVQTGPGLNWRWPTPFEAHEIVNSSQLRTLEIGFGSASSLKSKKESLMLTQDENIVEVQFGVQYTLKDAPDWIFNNRDQEETIRQVAETAIREIVGRTAMDMVLYEERDKLGPEVSKLMQQMLDRYKLGVQISNITIQSVQPPEQVQDAFNDAVKAGQDKERLKNEGQAYALDVLPKAKGDAVRLIQDAEAYRSRVVADAEGNASRFKQVLVEYQKAPAVTRDRMYLDTIQQILATSSKVMVDGKSGSNMIYLPIDKMIQQHTDKAAPGAAVAAPTNEIPTVELRAPKDSRSRDIRDREGR